MIKNTQKGMNISVIIPVYNGSSTISSTIKSLYTAKSTIREVIIINDGSSDGSEHSILTLTKKLKGIQWHYIHHKKPEGLAYCYNEGIVRAKNRFVLTLHQDMILEKDTIRDIQEPFSRNELGDIAASISGSNYPFSIWETYPFWQKCLFSRFVGKAIFVFDGKCTLYNKSLLLKAGLFDNTHHRTAGEDGDMRYRLTIIGKIVQSKAKVIHLHSAESNFPLKKYIAKHAQLAEAQGVLLRRHGLSYYLPRSFVETFFREILVIGVCIPTIRIWFFGLILLYSIVYTWNVYIYCKDLRCIILPFINIYLLIVSLYYSIRGFITGKQKI